MHNYNKLTGTFTLKSPLSHISESIGVTSYLCQEPILQPDRTTTEVFCYSGNAWRGQLRDLAAMYMLDKIDAKITLDSFHLLFSGGKIGGDQKIDIEKIKAVREAIPMLALFGGGLGNSIMPGLMRVGNCYPICREALPVLPNYYHAVDRISSYSDLTFEKEFSRVDDSKSDDLRKNYIKDPQADEKPKKKTGEVADQMRMTCELLCSGALLHTYIDFIDSSEIYLGVILSALTYFSENPFIGGQNNRGHGLVNLKYSLNGADFYETADKKIEVSKKAGECLANYDEYIMDHSDAIREILK
jgi:hypothetical protein